MAWFSKDKKEEKGKSATTIIVVAALGYFVDIYDLILFGIVREPSLKELGFGDSLMNKGVLLMDMQMLGMLVGGILWGILGDTKGRVKVLFGSILMYSLANIFNGLVNDITTYAVIRFIAGVGLAGELGAGITLIAETMSKENRGWGTMIVVVFGALGAVLAAMVGDMFTWRIAYYVGGALGLLLLLLRMGTFESGMFTKMDEGVKKGAFLKLFTKKERFSRYLFCILIGLPVWYTIGILIFFSPEFGKALGVEGTVKAGRAIMFAYLGLSFGDLISGLLSQVLKSRKKVVVSFILFNLGTALMFLFSKNVSLNYFYFQCFALGTATGFWALFVTIASEQFGTNLRSTVTTTVPNFVRGAVVPLTATFVLLKGPLGLIGSALLVGLVCLGLALYSTLRVKETFARDLDFVEVL